MLGVARFFLTILRRFGLTACSGSTGRQLLCAGSILPLMLINCQNQHLVESDRQSAPSVYFGLEPGPNDHSVTDLLQNPVLDWPAFRSAARSNEKSMHRQLIQRKQNLLHNW
ncbi:MAG: hypothetical protein KDK39_18435, partial [Leptospiraceae bacterium]|nr:hypothetical protein [Leptospiraceae bacterium]